MGAPEQSPSEQQAFKPLETRSAADEWNTWVAADIWSKPATSEKKEAREDDKEELEGGLRSPKNREEAAERWKQLTTEGLGETSLRDALALFGRQILTKKMDPEALGEAMKKVTVDDPKKVEEGIERLNEYLKGYDVAFRVRFDEAGKLSSFELYDRKKPDQFANALKIDSDGKLSASSSRINAITSFPETRKITPEEAAAYMGKTFFESVCP